MRQGGVGDPLEVADPLGGRHRVGAGIALLTLQRKPLGADVPDVRDQNQADRGEQQRQTHDIPRLDVRSDDERSERGGDDRGKQDERASSGLHRPRAHPDQEQRLVGQDGLREELQHHELRDAGVRDREHDAEPNLGHAESHTDDARFGAAPARARVQPTASPAPSVGGKSGSRIRTRRPLSATTTAVAFREARQVGAGVRVVAAHEQLASHLPAGSWAESVPPSGE